MLKALTQPVKTFILPFSVLSEDRKEPFTPEVEAAAAYVLAELERKGGGLLIKQPEEKLVSITRVGYPLWVVPKGETTFVFDGLNRSTYTLPYLEMPQVNVLMDDFERNSKTRETYRVFLSNHVNYFQQPTKKELTVNGLIANKDFLSEIDFYRKEASEATGPLPNSALLSPAIEESAITSKINELTSFYAFFKEETEKLQHLIRSVNKAASHYITELQYAAEAVREEADAKIRAQEELINPKVTSLNHEYNNKITNLTKSFEKEHLPLKKQKAKLQKEIETAKARIERYNKEVKDQAQKHHSYSERKWKEKQKQTKKELSTLEKDLKRTEKTLKALEDRQSLETFKLKSELDAKIKQERQPILDIEAFRDAKIHLYRHETEELKKQAQPVVEALTRIAKLREGFMANFEPLGVRADPKLKGAALFYVPFYLACYRAALAKRYFIVSPSTAGKLGFSAKLKGALGRSKIKDLLVPRFKAISALTENVLVLAQQDDRFEAQIEELAEKNNVLSNNLAQGNLKKGLACLKSEGWISEKEYQVFNEKIT